jgi:hypothetical protein
VLHALLKKKLRVIDTTLDYRDVEDHLTAAVLTRISYLSPKLASQLIEESIRPQHLGDRLISITHTDDADDADVWIEFWPRYTDATSSQSVVEPDAVLGIADHVYVVEAKRTDGWGQTPEQAARDWLSYYRDADEKGDAPEAVDGTLLLLGGVASVDHLNSLAATVQSLIASTHEVAPRIAWIAWTTLASQVRDAIDKATPQDARILADINLALTYHGFGAWMTYTQLSKRVGEPAIGLGADLLPTIWPAAPKQAAPVVPIPANSSSCPIELWRAHASPARIEAIPSQFSFLAK